MSNRTCMIEGCTRPFGGQRRCQYHYQQWYRSKDYAPEPHLRNMSTPVEERFWRFVDKDGPNGCWLWTGAKSRGYGHIRVAGKDVRSARLSYEMSVGPIPQGLTIDHLCRVIACVNPMHLEPVTNRENKRRATVIRTACPNGHPYNQATTHWYRGYRTCRICHKLRERERRERLAG